MGGLAGTGVVRGEVLVSHKTAKGAPRKQLRDNFFVVIFLSPREHGRIFVNLTLRFCHARGLH